MLMQLAVPSLRAPRAFRAFNAALRGNGCNLLAWRASARLPASQTAVLDAQGGTGWDLAAALLRPRRVQVTVAPLPVTHALRLTRNWCHSVWEITTACCMHSPCTSIEFVAVIATSARVDFALMHALCNLPNESLELLDPAWRQMLAENALT